MKIPMPFVLLLTWLLAGQLAAQQYTEIDTSVQSVGNKVCATCHGAYGQGNPAVGAPSLAGLESWYIKRQLEHFRAGWRGAQADYIPAFEMKSAVGAISNAEIEAVIAEITEWPEPQPEDYLEGDASNGRQLFSTCAACHGTAGEGNKALNAPGLANRDGWYLYRQLKLFQSGYRGSHPEDIHGATMRTSALFLRNDQAVKDVVAYINTLN